MKVAVNNHVSFRLVSARRPNLHHTVTRRPLLARAAAAPPDQIEKGAARGGDGYVKRIIPHTPCLARFCHRAERSGNEFAHKRQGQYGRTGKVFETVFISEPFWQMIIWRYGCSLQWKYTLEGYLRFLAESRYVYRTFERIIQSDDSCTAPSHHTVERWRRNCVQLLCFAILVSIVSSLWIMTSRGSPKSTTCLYPTSLTTAQAKTTQSTDGCTGGCLFAR